MLHVSSSPVVVAKSAYNAALVVDVRVAILVCKFVTVQSVRIYKV